MRYARCSKELAVGTGRQGVIRIRRAALEEVFGEPDGGDGYKTTAEWTLVFEDEVVATLYDYHRDEWHVGGRSPLAMEHVLEALARAGYVVEAER